MALGKRTGINRLLVKKPKSRHNKMNRGKKEGRGTQMQRLQVELDVCILRQN
jgi:hypothetical protein